MIRAKSLRSVLTIKSDILSEESIQDAAAPSMIFEDLLPFVLRKFDADYDVYVKRVNLQDNTQRFKKGSVPSNAHRAVTLVGSFVGGTLSETSVTQYSSPHRASTVVVTLSACYDNQNRLVEVIFSNLPQIQRMIMQAIVVIAPNYPFLNKITFRRCKLSGETMYELNKLLALDLLTHVTLDDSTLPAQNFSYLLEEPNNLKYLSLARCGINDKVCTDIATKLHYQTCSEKQLLTLNLSGNCITDVGAGSLAQMLRSNRHLRYLNLASNQLTDGGAFEILNVFLEFPMTYEEIVDKRKRLFTYLKTKNALVAKYMLSDCSSVDMVSVLSRKSNLGGKKLAQSAAGSEPRSGIANSSARAVLVADMMLEQFDDPFLRNKVVSKNGWCYCTGNMTLSYLNLAFNSLSYLSVKKILEVLQYHDSAKGTLSGLQNIIIQGNRLPELCPEYAAISKLINKNLQDKETLVGRRKSVVSSKSRAMSGTSRK